MECPTPAGKSRQPLITLALVAVLALLVYIQWRAWKHFDWNTFWTETRDVNWLLIIVAAALILSTYLTRALRWQVFLRASTPAPLSAVLPATLIGFTGLSLLGRPGEFVRPCLIARRTGASVSSQMGIWTMERIFDMAAYATIAAIDIFFARSLPNPKLLRVAGIAFVGVMVVLCAGTLLIRRAGPALFVRLEERAPRFLSPVLSKAHGFIDGLNAIRDVVSLFQIAALSVIIWLSIAAAYFLVAHAYPSLAGIPFSSMLLVVGFGMIGGLVQLPAVGGGAQVATILAMANVFSVPRELAVSCGILLWLVSFQTVVPFGLLLARSKHLSLRGVSEEMTS